MKKCTIPQLITIQEEMEQQIENAQNKEDIYRIKAYFVGKKGILKDLLKNIAQLPLDQKKTFGTECNLLKTLFLQKISQKQTEMNQFKKISQDFSLPGRGAVSQGRHPISLVLEKVQKIFESMGFEIRFGPEVEDEFHNFEGLNIPANHPARQMHDTFYLNEKQLLRTHTSPIQIHTMKGNQPPFYCAAPGKVFRRDFDVTHLPMFHQVEGFAVDKNIHWKHLKFIIKQFLSSYFNENIQIRLRPSYFPFTRPSAEVDMSCVICHQKGCRTCSHTGWLEIAGCGIIHPNVLKACDIDTNLWSGFAFGFGIERIAMISEGIHDIRLFYDNDDRFLKQFKGGLS